MGGTDNEEKTWMEKGAIGNACSFDDAAKLYCGFGKDTCNCILEAFQAIHARYKYILYASRLQVGQNAKPEVCPLAFWYVHTKKFFSSITL